MFSDVLEQELKNGHDYLNASNLRSQYIDDNFFNDSRAFGRKNRICRETRHSQDYRQGNLENRAQ